MKKKFIGILLVISFLIPFLFDVRTVITGDIPFWFDPAQSFLLALSNISKLTLIGHPSGGIHGLFYGPYDIWLMSLVLMISKDPRLVAFLLYTLPYFTVFPFIIYKFSKLFGKYTTVLLWLLFALNFGNYAKQIWNPHPAPIFILAVIYLLTTVDFTFKNKFSIHRLLLAGILGGCVVNLHLSFGIAFLLGLYVYLFVLVCTKKTSLLHFGKSLVVLTIGILITFIPYFLFEIRHGFIQTHAVIASVFGNASQTGIAGLTKDQIIYSFLNRMGLLLGVSFTFSILIQIILVGLLVYYIISKKKKLPLIEQKLLFILGSITLSAVVIFMTDKNPVWDYYFVGTEIISLLFLGYVTSKFTYVKYVLSAWIVLLIVFQFFQFITYIPENSSLKTEETAVLIVKNSIKTNNYYVFAYNPAIYTFDYDYLFLWLANKATSHNKSEITENIPVYIIFPKESVQKMQGYEYYLTPQKTYKTTGMWKVSDGSTIIRREKTI